MPSVTKQGVVRAQVWRDFESFLTQRTKAILIDRWIAGKQGLIDGTDGDLSARFSGVPFTPHDVTDEYEDLASRSPSPLAGLIVTSLSQMTYVEGVRRAGSDSNMEVWGAWQRNGMDAKQIALHRGAIGQGLAFGWVVPGRDPMTGENMPVMRAASAKRMAAFFDEYDDEFPTHAIMATPIKNGLGLHGGWQVTFIDETAVHYLSCTGNGEELKQWTYISHDDPHGMRVCPVVQYANRLDLDGYATGEVEPVIPLLRRIDQGTFDRLIVQRFGAWKVRYIAGMAKPSKETDAQAFALKLRIEDLLISDNNETKFGTLDATDVKGFIDSSETDLRMLCAVTQTPPHHVLGLSSNLQAESLAAAQDGLLRKKGDFCTLNGEAHEKLLRLTAYAMSNAAEAKAHDMQVRWKDTESRSLVQTANALGIVATALKVPVEMLWERLPGWSDQDSERAKNLIEKGGVDALLAEIALSLEQESAAAKGSTGANGLGGRENEPANG